MICRISSILLLLTCTLFGSDDARWNKLKADIIRSSDMFPGWCSKEKTGWMMDLIYATKPDLCVEIGVYQGNSMYPTLAALRFLNKGIAYAIDPWSKEPCLKGHSPGSDSYEWWNSVDFDQIYFDFNKKLKKYRLDRFCKVIRSTADDALSLFAPHSIDILHIDGNHSEKEVMKDVKNYLPKVKIGGYIWFDDAAWDSTQKALLYLYQFCREIESMSTGNCILFIKETEPTAGN